MSIPRFTAECAIYRSTRSYGGAIHAPVAEASNVIPAIRSVCLGLGLACALAVLDGIPFDEYAICGAFAAQCSTGA
jgi:hypothetical protein